MGIVLGLLAALGQAFGYVSIKKSFKELNPSIAFFFDACFGILIWAPFALVVGVDFKQLSLVARFALLSAILSEAFVFYALSKGHLSISGTIFASYPIFTILFSFFLNNERLQPFHWIFVFLTILGIIVISLPKEINKRELKEKMYIFWPLAAAITVGLSDTLSKRIIDKTSAETFLFALAFAQAPVAIGYLLVTKQPINQFKNVLFEFNKYKFAILGSFLNIAAVLFLWLAFSKTYASIASPLTASYPAILVILAMIFLKEKPNKREFFGLLMTVIGIIGIGIYY
jgi:drug/metabolite transporter (DMT)-like permease